MRQDNAREGGKKEKEKQKGKKKERKKRRRKKKNRKKDYYYFIFFKWRHGHGHERQGEKVNGIQTGSNVCHTVRSLHGGRQNVAKTPVDIQRLQDAICLEWVNISAYSLLFSSSFFPFLSDTRAAQLALIPLYIQQQQEMPSELTFRIGFFYIY